MGHSAFMAVFLKMINVFLIRDESDDVFATHALKFFGSFIASFEEVDENGETHPIVKHSFQNILSVRLRTTLVIS